MKIKADTLSFKDLFSPKGQQNDYNVVVPFYQRPYVWKPLNILKLFSDLQNDVEHNNNEYPDEAGYFSGPVVYITEGNFEGIKQNVLVDGQQRSTTLFFLLYAKLKKESLTYQKSLKSEAGIYYANEIRKLSKYVFTTTFIKNFLGEENIEETLRLISNRDRCPQTAAKLYLKIHNNLKLSYERKDLCQAIAFALACFNHYDYENEQNLRETILNYTLNCAKEIDSLQLNSETLETDSMLPAKFDVRTIDNALDWADSLYSKKELRSNIIRYVEGIILVDWSNYLLYKNKPKMSPEKDFALNNIMLCHLSTGNDQDAFTLFEVLNNTGIGLSNMDLIKNSFYKNTYGIKKEPPESISKIDQEWNEILYSTRDQYLNKYTQFLSFVYLSGNYALDDKVQDSPRKTIRALEVKFSNRLSYTVENLLQELSLMKQVRKLCDDVLAGNRQKNHAIKEIYKSSSWFKKAFSLLDALNQTGIMPLLIAPIISVVDTIHSLELKETFVKSLVMAKPKDNCISKDEIKTMEDFSHVLLCATLFLETKTLRSIVNGSLRTSFILEDKSFYFTQIKKNKRKDIFSRIQNLTKEIKSILLTPTKKEPSEFDLILSKMNAFNYKNFRGKYFLSLLNTAESIKGNNFNCDCIDYNKCDHVKFKFVESAPTRWGKNLEEDHIEPQTPGLPPNRYYQSSDREKKIDGIYNLFVVPKNSNIKKSNKPVMGVPVKKWDYDTRKPSGVDTKTLQYEELESSFSRIAAMDLESNEYNQEYDLFIQKRLNNLTRIALKMIHMSPSSK